MKPQTAQDYIDLVNRVTLVGALGLIKAKLTAAACAVDGQPGLHVEVSVGVPDSVDGKPTEIYFLRDYSIVQLNGSAIPFEDRLLEQVKDAVVHEAFEGFRVDGAAIANPHTRRLVPRGSSPRRTQK